jgi:hypothetical protein
LSCKRAFELLVGDAQEALRAQSHAAHVVDEDVDPSMAADGLVDEPLGTRRLAEIHRYGVDSVDPFRVLDRAWPATTRTPSATSERTTARPMPLLAP